MIVFNRVHDSELFIYRKELVRQLGEIHHFQSLCKFIAATVTSSVLM